MNLLKKKNNNNNEQLYIIKYQLQKLKTSIKNSKETQPKVTKMISLTTK